MEELFVVNSMGGNREKEPETVIYANMLEDIEVKSMCSNKRKKQIGNKY